MSDLVHLSGRTNLARMTGTTSLVDLDAERHRRGSDSLRGAEVPDRRSRRRTARRRADVVRRARTVLGRDGPDAA